MSKPALTATTMRLANALVRKRAAATIAQSVAKAPAKLNPPTTSQQLRKLLNTMPSSAAAQAPKIAAIQPGMIAAATVAFQPKTFSSSYEFKSDDIKSSILETETRFSKSKINYQSPYFGSPVSYVGIGEPIMRKSDTILHSDKLASSKRKTILETWSGFKGRISTMKSRFVHSMVELTRPSSPPLDVSHSAESLASEHSHTETPTPSKIEKPKRSISFNDVVAVTETYGSDEYDRRCPQIRFAESISLDNLFHQVRQPRALPSAYGPLSPSLELLLSGPPPYSSLCKVGHVSDFNATISEKIHIPLG
eukprot:Colp12_sorted_trinity150504_noHs@17407